MPRIFCTHLVCLNQELEELTEIKCISNFLSVLSLPLLVPLSYRPVMPVSHSWSHRTLEYRDCLPQHHVLCLVIMLTPAKPSPLPGSQFGKLGNLTTV